MSSFTYSGCVNPSPCLQNKYDTRAKFRCHMSRFLGTAVGLMHSSFTSFHASSGSFSKSASVFFELDISVLEFVENIISGVVILTARHFKTILSENSKDNRSRAQVNAVSAEKIILVGVENAFQLVFNISIKIIYERPKAKQSIYEYLILGLGL
ncbi:hypothetical protein V6N12_054257 [Hibiscus sabdariffa]|uniref:Uncharacterized protein n=1 Tax=Hibiscus sabdariffa TaxID=183260 RepID=A0ABR2CZW1_9ROSI